MTYHLYAQANGFPDILPYQLKLDDGLYPGYEYLGAFDEKPDVDGKKYVGGRWVWGGSAPEYLLLRSKAYPAVADSLDALWHAMEIGLLPMVPEFFDPIKAVKVRFPKA